MAWYRAQQNYKAAASVFLMLAAWLLTACPAASGTISRSQGPDPILSGGPPGPCDRRTESPDFVPGTDVNGNPVVPTDVGAQPPPLPEAVLVPLGRHGRGQAVLSGKQLAGLLVRPACPKPHH